MATPSNILVANNYCVVQQNTATDIVPQSGAQIGIVVVAEPTGLVGVGQQVMFLNSGAQQFTQGTEAYQIILVANILLTYTGAPS